MRPLISESSFGYALTEEFASGRHGSLRGAPMFPTQNQEGLVGGYDVELPFTGLPLYLQFKSSDYLSRRSAKEWDDFNSPYYRMHLRPLRFSEQHNLLLDWETLGNEVYYVAPEFHTQNELNEFYLSHSVVDNSAFFSPNDIGILPDHFDHYVVFDRGGIVGYFHSKENRKVRKRFTKGGFIEYFSMRISQRKRKIDFEFLENQNKELIEFLSKREKDVQRLKKFELELKGRPHKTRKDAASFLSYLARTYFDAELFFLTDDSNNRKDKIPIRHKNSLDS